MNKEATITFRDVLRVFFKRTFLWIFLAVLAFSAVLTLHYFAKDRMTVSAIVNFSYDGIENGRDPAGTRFEERDIVSDNLIIEVCNAAGRILSADEVYTIQSSLHIRGNVPTYIFDGIIDHQSIYGEKEVADVENVRDSSYFPSQYTVTFYYNRAGFSVDDGVQFLKELLAAYEDYFYNRYGYNSSLEQSIASVDYNEYDYINAIDILDKRLISLRSYLTTLSGLDNTRFVSKITGYSFSDLIDAVDTVRNEDINWITSYIVSNNITKNRQQLIDYYQYRIEDAQRELAQRQSRLYTLTTQIEGYKKTMAVFLGVVDGTSSQDSNDPGDYEFSQKSLMYDSLINEKVSCETSISDTQERIYLYERRVGRLISGESTGNPQLVDETLHGIDNIISQFYADTKETADEFFRTVWLKQAFRVVVEPTYNPIPVMSLIRESLRDILVIEALIFGLFVLFIPSAVKKISRSRNMNFNTRSDYNRRSSTPSEGESYSSIPGDGLNDSNVDNTLKEAVAK